MSDTPEIRYLFIRRPIFAGVISIVIVLLGAFALYSLPINRYPPITPPSVQVSAVYPGATAEDVAAAVAAPIEQQLSGLDGLLYFKSSNASDGTMNLQVYFDLSRDLDLAAVDVQNQVNLAEPQLPQEVVRQGITITKAQTDILAVIALSSKDPQYDAGYLNNYAQIYITDELKRVPGVGDAQAIGSLQFSMLLSLDPDRMAQLGLTVADVQAAVQEQNTTNPAGRIGREPAPKGNQLTIPVTTLGRLSDPKQFADIIVRADSDGSMVRVRDIGKVTLGSQSYDLVGRVNRVPTAAIRLYLRPGANALNVKAAVVARMNELSRNFPAGVSWFVPFDTTPFITASIDEVAKTLFEAMALVTLVVFIFLQNWRTTLIPVLAVPVAIVGTFFGLLMLGFQINLLTLFALVLAIGIVVDDAIVVIENVERIMAEEKVSPRVAADRAMGQVASALIAIVLSLCAVFLPVAFLGGITGKMYTQFAITLVVSVVISGMVALTLTPALCAVLLKPNQGESRNRLFGWFNRGFARVTERYVRSVGGVIARPSRWLALFAVMLVLIAVLVRRVPSGFIPTEDKGYFAVVIQLPDGASLQRTVELTRQIEDYLLKQPAVAYVVNFSGLSFVLGTNQTNAASMFVLLKPWDERAKKEDQLDAVLAGTNKFLFGLKDAVAFGFNLPEIPGLGTTAGLEVNLQDRSVNDIRKFAGLVNEYTQQANAQPELQGVTVADAGECAPDLRQRRPGKGEVARSAAVGGLLDPADHAFDAVRQRFQPVRADLPGAAGGAVTIPPQAGRHRPAVRARPGRGHDPDLESGPDPIPRRTQSGPAVQRVYFRAGDRPAQAGFQQRTNARGGSASSRLGVHASRRGLRLQRPVVSGGGCQWPGWTHLRVRPPHGVPGPGGTVRELVHPVRRALRHSVRGFRRVPRRLAPRDGERRLLPDRSPGRDRARGKERHPDRGVRQPAPGPGTLHSRGRDRGGPRAVPADSDDLVRLHSRRQPTPDSQRGRCPEQALDRDRRVLRDAHRDHGRDLLHPTLLFPDRSAGRAGALPPPGDRAGAGRCRGRSPVR